MIGLNKIISRQKLAPAEELIHSKHMHSVELIGTSSPGKNRWHGVITKSPNLIFAKKQHIMPHLFSSLTIKNIEFKNRIVVSPMCEYSSQDGFAKDWHLVHLGSRATGGAALIITEATAVSAEGRISYGDLGIWKDEHIEKLKQVTGFIKQHGAFEERQLQHA